MPTCATTLVFRFPRSKDGFHTFGRNVDTYSVPMNGRRGSPTSPSCTPSRLPWRRPSTQRASDWPTVSDRPLQTPRRLRPKRVLPASHRSKTGTESNSSYIHSNTPVRLATAWNDLQWLGDVNKWGRDSEATEPPVTVTTLRSGIKSRVSAARERLQPVSTATLTALSLCNHRRFGPHAAPRLAQTSRALSCYQRAHRVYLVKPSICPLS